MRPEDLVLMAQNKQPNFAQEFFKLPVSQRAELASWLGVRRLNQETDRDLGTRIIRAAREKDKLIELVGRVTTYAQQNRRER